MPPPAAPWQYQRGGPLSPNYGSFGGGPVATSGRSMNDPGRMVETMARRYRNDPGLQMAAADRLAAPARITPNGIQQPFQSRSQQQGQRQSLPTGLNYLYSQTNQFANAVVPPAGGSQPAKPQQPTAQPQGQISAPSPLGPMTQQRQDEKKKNPFGFNMQTGGINVPSWMNPFGTYY